MGDSKMEPCSFCGSDATEKQGYAKDVHDLGEFHWECEVCGHVRCGAELLDLEVPRLSAQSKAMVAAFLCERNLRKIPMTQIVEELTDETQSRPYVVTLDGILEVMRHVFASPQERMNRALVSIQALSDKLGCRVAIEHPAMVYAGDADEAIFILGAMQEQGLISWMERGFGMPMGAAELTIEGYNQLAELDRERHGIDSDQAFVAMWFDESMNEAYEQGIAPAITEAGYEPMRIDAVEKLGGIDDQIIAEIRRSRFMVADFTGGREGVYYEAGFAGGLGIPVIFTVRKNEIDSLHFDTRQYRHIDWEDPEDLRKRLKVSIEANIPKAPGKV